MNKILITGSSGFVGKNLYSYLLDKAFSLISLSREKDSNYSLIDSNYIEENNIHTIIHLAGKAHDLKKISNDHEYYEVNTELTKTIFNVFIKSNASIFIYFSSVKAAKDKIQSILTEEVEPTPFTVYGKSKLAAEKYIQSLYNHNGKRIYILRPCMIHGPGNKGNLNLLYKIVSKGIPWPLGSFENKRSFCSIENLCFVINELIINQLIQSGIYNIADDEPLSTNQLIELISRSQNKNSKIIKINKTVIQKLAKFGDLFKLPLNSERLQKLTESYVVSNRKIKDAIGKSLPISGKDGMIKTLNSFK